jgi:hypothetical protein
MVKSNAAYKIYKSFNKTLLNFFKNISYIKADLALPAKYCALSGTSAEQQLLHATVVCKS